MATIIKTDGTETTAEKKELTLEFMQQVVEGYIQIVPLRDGRLLVCNDEGKLKELPVNNKVTGIWQKYYGFTDIIVGNVIIAEDGEIE